MRVLVTGHNGYIGSVLVPILQEAGHEVVGFDTFFFEDGTLGPMNTSVKEIRKDIRDVTLLDLRSFDAVIHLAALSNDPLGNLDVNLTYDINHLASVRLAKLSKQAGTHRFLFSSSCSTYGAGGMDAILDEQASFNPVTPYGISKVRAEQDLTKLADSSFSPTFLRNATAYGLSPKLRSDLVVNNLTGWAFLTGDVLIMSDGTPWRPLVHVEDIARAFLAVLEAPQDVIHNQAFNVGSNEQNFQICDVADLVKNSLPGSVVRYAEGAGPDNRCYRVSFQKINKMLPAFRLHWSLKKGICQLRDGYKQFGLRMEDFTGEKFVRLKRIKALVDDGVIDNNLRWKKRQ